MNANVDNLWALAGLPTGFIGDILGMINPTIGTVAKTVGLGVTKTRKPRSRKRKSSVGDVLSMINPTIGTVDKTVGLDVEKTREGKGVVSDMAKSGLKAIAPVFIDAASSAVKNLISGMGANKRRTTKQGPHRA